MKITIIGAGNAGTTVAADLALKGHEVTLLKTSNKLHNEHFSELLKKQQIIMTENGETHTVDVHITTDMGKAIPGRELLILYIQTNYHEDLIRRISPYLSDGQTILIEPGYLSTCYFLQHCDRDLTIVEAESSPIDCRIIAPGHVNVLFRNVRNPVGVYPAERMEKAKHVLDQLAYPFTYVKSVAEAALHNPNLIVHTIGAILSVPRIEYAATHGHSYSMYREVFTPHVWNLVLALDKEKMDVLEKLGSERLAYVDACKYRNSLSDKRDATEVFFDYAYNFSPEGPDIPDSRYITEDVPEGLVMLESLGTVLSVPTPACTGLINCAEAMLCREFRKEGRTIERLGTEQLAMILGNTI